jgi:predicted secreted acid phosphatase
MIVRRLLTLVLALCLTAGTLAAGARADSCSVAQATTNTCTSYDGGLPNYGVLATEIFAYYDSGKWQADATAVDARVDAYVTKRLHDHVRKPAVVFDIDDTSLSDYPYEKAHDLGYDPKTYNAMVASGFPAIVPTLNLVKHLRAEGVAIFFVTGRRIPLRAVTLANLAKVGYPTPNGLYLRKVDDHAKSVVPFKTSARAAIAISGFTILASVGDQWSDLRGGYAEKIFKLPNPMYFIP